MKLFKKTTKGGKVVWSLLGIKFSYKSSLKKLQNDVSKLKDLTNRLVSDKMDKLVNLKMFNYLYGESLTIKDKEFLIEERFCREVGYFPNLKNPQTFNEKINWLKINYEHTLLEKIVNKYTFKDYIKEQIGAEYVIPLLGVWEDAADIDIDKLPNSFVLKVNWSSYQNFIVKDKSKFDFSYALGKMNSWMLPWTNIYYASFYNAYKNVKPVIIAEEYKEQKNGSLNDYKFYCFNGQPKYLFVVDEGFSKDRPLCWDVDDNHIYKINGDNIENKSKQPKNMLKMLELAKKLSKPFPFVRVDFYEVEDKIYVGEMTFYPGNGFNKFSPKSLDVELGKELDLSGVMGESKT